MKRENLPSLGSTDELLIQILAALKSIDAKLTPIDLRGAAELLNAIYATIGNRNVAASELVVLAQLPEGTALHAAIVAYVGRLNARSLGKRLQDIEGSVIDGLVALRTGSDSAGIVWRVTVASTIPIAIA